MSEVVERLATGVSDSYAIRGELGHGGAAVVYVADDLRHERRGAITRLLPQLTSRVASARFLREVKLTAGLTDPHPAGVGRAPVRSC